MFSDFVESWTGVVAGSDGVVVGESVDNTGGACGKRVDKTGGAVGKAEISEPGDSVVKSSDVGGGVGVPGGIVWIVIGSSVVVRVVSGIIGTLVVDRTGGACGNNVDKTGGLSGKSGMSTYFRQPRQFTSKKYPDSQLR